MRFLFYCFLLFALFFSSCQQRYAHVKKVKADKSISQKEANKLSVKEDSNHIVRLSDSSFKQQLENGEKHNSLPNVSSGNTPPSSKEKSKAFKSQDENQVFERYYNSHRQKLRPENKTKDEPLTKEEQRLVVAIFIFWIVAMSLVLGIITSILVVFLFLALFIGSIEALLLLLVILFGVGILVLVLAYFLGKNDILRKIDKPIRNADLLRYFLLIVLGLTVISFIPYLSILVHLALFIWAIVYIVRYNKKKKKPTEEFDI